MYDSVIILVAQAKDVNKYGDIVINYTERQVFADLRSIGQTEFYQAQAVGLRPEVKFVLADYLEYQNEKIIRYQAFNSEEEEEFSVIRTYRAGNELEIVCRRGID